MSQECNNGHGEQQQGTINRGYEASPEETNEERRHSFQRHVSLQTIFVIPHVPPPPNYTQIEVEAPNYTQIEVEAPNYTQIEVEGPPSYRDLFPRRFHTGSVLISQMFAASNRRRRPESVVETGSDDFRDFEHYHRALRICKVVLGVVLFLVGLVCLIGGIWYICNYSSCC